MPKPTYDDLIFLIAYFCEWLNWVGEERLEVLEALREKNGYKNLVKSDERYGKHVDEKKFKKASKILLLLKDEIKKINGFWK